MALVGEAGEKVAVADDQLAPPGPRLDAGLGVVDVLAAVRRVEQGDGARVRLGLPGQDSSKHLADRAVRGLPRGRVRPSFPCEAFREQAQLGRGPGAVQAFQHDESLKYSGIHRRRV